MNWDKETIIRFLGLYQKHPCIWDPENAGHKNRQRVNDAWNSIRDNLDVPCTVKDLKRKKESLMSAYRGYKTKIKKSLLSGSDAVDVYQPSWFAFEFMDSFLNSVYTCNSTINTEDEDLNIGHYSFNEQSPTDQNTRNRKKHKLNRRRQNNPPELIQAQKRMDEAYSVMQHHSQLQRQDEEDECSTFGVLVAKKLRKLSEERRYIMMANIHQLFINERHSFSLPDDSSNQSNSAAIVLSYTPSSPQK